MSDAKNQLADCACEIETLIRQENDPQQRSVLMVLLSLTNSLHDTARILTRLEREHDATTASHQAQLESHRDFINEQLALRRFMAAGLGVLQILTLGAAGYVFNELMSLRKSVDRHEVFLDQFSAGAKRGGDGKGD